jgi:hypothetical protein
MNPDHILEKIICPQKSLPSIHAPAKRPVSPDSMCLSYATAAALLPAPGLILFGKRLRNAQRQAGAVLAAWIEWLIVPILCVAIFGVLMIAEMRSRRRPTVHQPVWAPSPSMDL